MVKGATIHVMTGHKVYALHEANTIGHAGDNRKNDYLIIINIRQIFIYL